MIELRCFSMIGLNLKTTCFLHVVLDIFFYKFLCFLLILFWDNLFAGFVLFQCFFCQTRVFCYVGVVSFCFKGDVVVFVAGNQHVPLLQYHTLFFSNAHCLVVFTFPIRPTPCEPFLGGFIETDVQCACMGLVLSYLLYLFELFIYLLVLISNWCLYLFELFCCMLLCCYLVVYFLERVIVCFCLALLS